MNPAAQAPDADSLRRVLHAVFARPAYQWTQHPDPLAQVKAALAAAVLWWSRLQRVDAVLLDVLVVLLIGGVLALSGHAVWLFARAFRGAPPSALDIATPGELRDAAWYHGESDRLAASGRFADAMQAEFVALVLALDARHALRYHPSKTPGEYAREIAASPDLRREFRSLVGRLYLCAFGGVDCAATDFANWREMAAADRYAPAD